MQRLSPAGRVAGDNLSRMRRHPTLTDALDTACDVAQYHGRVSGEGDLAEQLDRVAQSLMSLADAGEAETRESAVWNELRAAAGRLRQRVGA